VPAGTEPPVLMAALLLDALSHQRRAPRAGRLAPIGCAQQEPARTMGDHGSSGFLLCGSGLRRGRGRVRLAPAPGLPSRGADYATDVRTSARVG